MRASAFDRSLDRAFDVVADFREDAVARRRAAAAGLIELCRAYSVRMPDHAFFSHVTAARLHGMWLPNRMIAEPVLHISAVEPKPLPRGRGIAGHRTSVGRVRIVELHGLRVAAPEDAWLQLAPRLVLEELVAAGDSLVRHAESASSIDALVSRAGRATRMRGIRMAREAVELVRTGVDSPQESRLRLVLVAAGLPEPRIGFRVRDGHGRFIATPDLAYPNERVALEYEGDGHRIDRNQFEYDIRRYEALASLGWKVIRVVAADLTVGAPRLVQRVRAALLASASTTR